MGTRWQRESRGRIRSFLFIVMALSAGGGSLVAGTRSVAAATVLVGCSDTAGLIAAINAANTAGSGTILLCPSAFTVSAPYRGADGLPEITGAITVLGSNGTATITRSTAAPTEGFRLFDVAAGASLSLTHVAISDGSPSGDGGAIYNAGGSVTVTSSTLTKNHAGGAGGAVYNAGGTVAIASTVLSGNDATTGGGGAVSNAGGGTLTVVSTKIVNNATGGSGGAINNGASNGSVSASTISGNHASASGASGGGGGIWSSGVLTITRSTLSGNVAVNGSGGAILTPGALTVSVSTLTANRASVAGGGMEIPVAGLEQRVVESTLARNVASLGANIDIGSEEPFVMPMVIRQTIVADPSGGGSDCSLRGGSFFDDLGFNLESAADCGFTASGDKRFTDPMLDTLRLNGGTTQTLALETGSPAIDAGPATCTATDQRGMQRPLGSACDIGAVENSIDVTITPPPAPLIMPSSVTVTAASLTATPLKNIVCTVNGKPAKVTDRSGLGTTTATGTVALTYPSASPHADVVCRGVDSKHYAGVGEAFYGISTPGS